LFDDGYQVYVRVGNKEECLDAAGKKDWTYKFLVDCFPVYKRRDMLPKLTLDDWRQMYEVAQACNDECCFPIDLVDYAKVHNDAAETRGLIPHSIAQLWNAVCGPTVSPTNGLMAQYQACKKDPCRKCQRKEAKAKSRAAYHTEGVSFVTDD
jgi:hypothetical protein